MDAWVCGMFPALLFGSETWVLTTSAMKVLAGFHIRATYRMARVNKPRKDPQTGVWEYPSTALALEEVGLHTIEHYMQVFRQTIAVYIVNWPIFDFCKDEERKRGNSPRRTFWWEQPMDLDLARGISQPPG